MFVDASLLILLLSGLAAFIAGFVKGLTGFGFAVAFTPIFSLLFGKPREVVFFAIVLGAILSVGVITEVRHALKGTTAIPLLAGTAIGTPLGVVLLGLLDVHILKLAISSLAILATLLRVAKLPLKVSRNSTALAVGGLLGGILNGCSSMGGPVLALIVAMQEREIHESRAILVTFNLLSYLLAIGFALNSGIVQPSWLISGIWLLPLAVAGSGFGMWMAQRVRKDAFDRFIIFVIGISGITGLASIFIN